VFLPLDMLGGLAQANIQAVRLEDVVPHDYLLCVVANLLKDRYGEPERGGVNGSR
jgi:hypothetical protein